MGIDPRIQARIKAMNDVFGIEPEQIQEGLSPADIASLLGRSVDSVTGAPTRSAVGAYITGEDPVKAAQNQFGANPDLAPSFGTVEDMVLDPVNLTPFAGKHAARLAALNELGAVGKYELADKVGNVIKAEREFAPIVKERKALSSANKAALKGEPEREGVELAFSKKPFEFPDAELLDKFKGKNELSELFKRLVEDRHTAIYGTGYANEPKRLGQIEDQYEALKKAIMDKKRAANRSYEKGAETKAMNRINAGGSLKKVKDTKSGYGNDYLALDDIWRGAADGNETAKRIFVEAWEQGKYAQDAKVYPALGKDLARLYKKLKKP
jgi:hypothetical protein